MSLFVWGIIIALLAGGIIAGATNYFNLEDSIGRKRITLKEYAIGAVICCLIVVPSVVVVGNKVALGNNLKYHEYWSGYELQAQKETIPCSRDGRCQYEYNCDPYTVVHTRSVPNADGKGSHTETYTTTEYHHCPYSTVEWDFNILTTLDDYHIERTFPDDPKEWRGGEGIPGGVRHGAPPFWQAAYDRIKAGDPGPVTVRKTYDNYILASQSSILKKYSDAVDTYAKVLPKLSHDTHSFYYADKAYFVGVGGSGAWNKTVMRFNAALGSDLQGDLHVVLVKDSLIKNPDEYAGALNAYWTSKDLGRDALSKNGLVVVIGTDGDTATWVRAFTGMPVGNEELLADIQRELTGADLNPDTLLGHPTGTIKGDDVEISHGDGLLEDAVWGTHTFARVCMTCKDEGGNGFGYLGGEIQPTSGQKTAILMVAFFLSLVVWSVFVLVGSDNKERYNR